MHRVVCAVKGAMRPIGRVDLRSLAASTANPLDGCVTLATHRLQRRGRATGSLGSRWWWSLRGRPLGGALAAGGRRPMAARPHRQLMMRTAADIMSRSSTLRTRTGLDVQDAGPVSTPLLLQMFGMRSSAGPRAVPPICRAARRLAARDARAGC